MRRTCALLFLLSAVARAADVPPETQNAARALADFGRVCESYGKLLWGQSLCGPLVLVNPSNGSAISNRPDPDGAFVKHGDVFLGRFPKEIMPSNTAIQWNGQAWSTVLMPLPEEPFARIRLLAHESFHRIQPGLGLNASDAANAQLDTEAGRLWLRLELRAMASALRREDAEGRRSAIDAMLFRMVRHRRFPGSEANEAAMERQEGLAEYTGTLIGLRTTGEVVAREAREVEAFEGSDAFARSFAYKTGPAPGLLLDRYAGGWRAKVKSTSLESLLDTALDVELPKDLEADARERAARYGYQAVAAAEREREERHQAFLTELTEKFVNNPTLDFPNSTKLYRTFNPNNLVPFPPRGTYYPDGTFTAEWGKLQVESGGALLAPDNMSVRVTAPKDPNARPIHGDGWTLELAPGWTIQPAQRPGAFDVVRLPTSQ